jgi:hypothetical protein
MNREVHVRICEGLGVKFPGPTRQKCPKLPWLLAAKSTTGQRVKFVPLRDIHIATTARENGRRAAELASRYQTVHNKNKRLDLPKTSAVARE